MPAHLPTPIRRPAPLLARAASLRERNLVPSACGRLALASVLVIAGCGGSPHRKAVPSPAASTHSSPAAAPAPVPRVTVVDELGALLGRRARALLAGDAAALVATATGHQRARDRRAARRARALPLRTLELSAITTEASGRHARMRVRTKYALQGAEGRFQVTRPMTAVRTEAGWRIASDGSTRRRDRLPWEVATYHAQDSAHFLVLAPKGIRGGGLLAALEHGRRRLASALPGVRLPDHLLVLVAAGVGQARKLTRGIHGVETLAAVSQAQVREAGPERRVIAVTGQRLLVVWSAYASFDDVDRGRVVTHELTHAALVRRTSGRAPAWLVEGVAMYASGDRQASQAGLLVRGVPLAGISTAGERSARRSASLRALASPNAISRRTGVAQAAGYAYASAAAFAIVANHGRATLLRLYDVFSNPHLRGTPGRRLEARAIRRTLHESLPALEREVRAYAASRAG